MKIKQRTLLLNEKQIKMLDNGGKEESHILNEVSELERYCDSKLGEEWNKQ